MLTLTPAQLDFVTARMLATLTTVRPDGTPHVVPVAFTWDADGGRARITTRVTSVKARLIDAGGARPTGGAHVALRSALCQVEGQRWLTLEGSITLSRDPAQIAVAVARYADRYRVLGVQPERVVLHLVVERVLGTVR